MYVCRLSAILQFSIKFDRRSTVSDYSIRSATDPILTLCSSTWLSMLKRNVLRRIIPLGLH
jgi:hypothetical protein